MSRPQAYHQLRNVTSDDEEPTAAAEPRPGPRWPWQRLVSSGNLEYDRVLFFSDAIFAIAITLLVVDIRVPRTPSGQVSAIGQLQESLPQMIGFGISFAVIAVFWVGHHTLFRHIVAFDRGLIWLNLLFLGTVAFLPYPTSLLAATAGQRASVVFYAAWSTVAGLAETAIWLYACRVPGLVTGASPRLRQYYALRMLRSPVVFGLSIPVALVWPSLAPYTWLLIAVLGFALRRRWPAERGPGGREPA